MNKLPPLPPATERCFVGPATSGHWEGLIRESSVREYGQQCRDAALDEAAKVCVDIQNGWASDDHLECAEGIKGLK